jgi:hypothetical protein
MGKPVAVSLLPAREIMTLALAPALEQTTGLSCLPGAREDGDAEQSSGFAWQSNRHFWIF